MSLEEELVEARTRNARRLTGILRDQDAVVRLNGKRNRPRDGVSYSEIYEVYKGHDGKCAICGVLRGARNHALDHDHKTLKVRGILCGKCNMGLGYFQDDPKLLRAAIQYLMRAKKAEKPLGIPYG